MTPLISVRPVCLSRSPPSCSCLHPGIPEPGLTRRPGLTRTRLTRSPGLTGSTHEEEDGGPGPDVGPLQSVATGSREVRRGTADSRNGRPERHPPDPPRAHRRRRLTETGSRAPRLTGATGITGNGSPGKTASERARGHPVHARVEGAREQEELRERSGGQGRERGRPARPLR